MNGRTAKKIRRVAKRDWRQRVRELYDLPLYSRLKFAWHIIMRS